MCIGSASVPHDDVAAFVARGAVRISYALLERVTYNGTRVLEPYTDIVHFWDAQGRELGYWSVMSHWFGLMMFTPGQREWHPDILATQEFWVIPNQEDD